MSWTDIGSRRRVAIVFGIWAVSALPLLAGEEETPELDVPYVPTHQKAVEEMLNLAKVTGKDYVIDLGCGDGRIVITAAKKYKARCLGVDLDPRRIRESNKNASQAGVTKLVTFRKADVMDTDVRQASVVTLFLLEAVNVRLRPRLFAQLKPGTRVVSNGFHMRDWKADKTVRHEEAYNRVIYRWIIPAPVGGTWTWQGSLAGKQTAYSLKLEQEFQVVRGELSLPQAAAAPIAEPSLAGKELRFTASVPVGKEKVVVAYRGLADGDVLRGTQEWRGGPQAGTHHWLAKRNAVNLTGRWQIRPARRPRWNGTLRIQRKDGKLSATYVRDAEPKKELPVPGFYVWGSSLRFEVATDGWSAMAFSGSLEGDTGSGSAGREQAKRRTPWSAKRLPKK